MNHEGMEGSVIITTGGGSGMGVAVAKDFAERGVGIVISDLDEARGLAVTDSIMDANGKVVYKRVDATDKQAVLAAADEAEQKLGAITSWTNSTGVSKMVPFLKSSEELQDLTVNVNLKATFLCCQVTIEEVLKHGGGIILNMFFLSGKKAGVWQTVYCASKSGVQGLTQSTAKEFADRNIRVNSICPGIVHTETWEKLEYEYTQKKGTDSEEVTSYSRKNIPIHRLVDLQDVINVAVFLLTNNSAYLTGQSINLTGGEWTD